MSFTTTFQLAKPDYKATRYDIPLNANFDIIEAGMKGFPSATALGSSGNFDDVVLTEGCQWRDTTNHISKVYGNAAWEELHSNSIRNQFKNITIPGTPDADSFYYYAYDYNSVSCPHWKLENGNILCLFVHDHVADIDASSLTSLTNAYGTADGTLEDIGDTSASDVSGVIENNFQECTTQINLLKTIVEDIRTKFNGILTQLENMGLNATS